MGESYVCRSGEAIHAGRFSRPNAVLDLIAAAPDNSWIKLNTNRFQDAWSPAESRQSLGTGQYWAPSNPSRILGKWGSAAWDPRRSRYIVFGGGHANSTSNEVYTWSAHTRQWRHAFFDTEIHQVDSYPTYRSVDGNLSPVSSHTYSNNNYLPIIDRFYTGGGAAAGNGEALKVWGGPTGDTKLRDAGGFTLDTAFAAQGRVGGATGSNVKYGQFANLDRPGARAWQLRDWCDGRCAQLSSASRIESGTAYAEENGHDVLYSVINDRMFRIEFVDDNQVNDIVTQVAGYQNNRATNGALAYDPSAKLLVMPAGAHPTVRFFFVDLKLPTDLNRRWGAVSSLIGDTQAGFIDGGLSKSSGLAFQPGIGAFVLWYKGRQPWLIYPNNGALSTQETAWQVVMPSMDDASAAPPDVLDANDSGVIGKFRYAPDLGCCIAICDIFNGDIWALKLAGWADPRS